MLQKTLNHVRNHEAPSTLHVSVLLMRERDLTTGHRLHVAVSETPEPPLTPSRDTRTEFLSKQHPQSSQTTALPTPKSY